VASLPPPPPLDEPLPPLLVPELDPLDDPPFEGPVLPLEHATAKASNAVARRSRIVSIL
jgi:hypothetical protein